MKPKSCRLEGGTTKTPQPKLEIIYGLKGGDWGLPAKAWNGSDTISETPSHPQTARSPIPALPLRAFVPKLEASATLPSIRDAAAGGGLDVFDEFVEDTAGGLQRRSFKCITAAG